MAVTKKILIMGAGGYIGSNLKHELLLRGHDVYHTTSSQLYLTNKSFHFDILNPSYQLLKMFINSQEVGFDVVYIIAWPLLDKYFDSKHSNVILPNMMVLHSLLVDDCDIKNIVYAGTCYEYGLVEGSLSEDTSCNPISDYAKAKLALCQYVFEQHSKSNVNIKWLRIFYPYGKNQRESSLIPSLEKAIDTKQEVFKMSKGDQIRDFIHIDNLVNLFVSLGLSSCIPSGIYNCGSGSPVRLIDFVQSHIEDYCVDNKQTITLDTTAYPYRKDEPFSFWANMSKANNVLLKERNK
jgi:dTDP-6-deoxy-L-talose 4-dehydrogenase (NAD+)